MEQVVEEMIDPLGLLVTGREEVQGHDGGRTRSVLLPILKPCCKLALWQGVAFSPPM